jgi:hypothetical protein
MTTAEFMEKKRVAHEKVQRVIDELGFPPGSYELICWTSPEYHWTFWQKDRRILRGITVRTIIRAIRARAVKLGLSQPLAVVDSGTPGY